MCISLPRSLLIIFALALGYSVAYSQSLGVQAKIIDRKTTEPIPFAAIRLYANGKLIGGVVSNQDGDFQLPPKDKLTPDSLVISCIR